MTTATATTVAEETACADPGLCHLPDDLWYEMVDGELVELPPMRMSQSIVADTVSRLFNRHIQSENLPYLSSAGASFSLGLPRGNFRIPDVHVTAARRALASLHDELRAWEGSPDIAVEVVSPTDAYVDVVAKANLYLRQGASTVLLVDLYHREVTVRQATGEVKVLIADDALTGDPVLPGFSCQVAEVFSELDRMLALETEAN